MSRFHFLKNCQKIQIKYYFSQRIKPQSTDPLVNTLAIIPNRLILILLLFQSFSLFLLYLRCLFIYIILLLSFFICWCYYYNFSFFFFLFFLYVGGMSFPSLQLPPHRRDVANLLRLKIANNKCYMERFRHWMRRLKDKIREAESKPKAALYSP